jgi:hypothetical protein
MTILAQSLLFLSLALNYIRPTESIQLQQQKIKKENKIKRGYNIYITWIIYIYVYIYALLWHMSEIDGILIVVRWHFFFFSFLISLRDLSFYMNRTVLEYFLGHFLLLCVAICLSFFLFCFCTFSIIGSLGCQVFGDQVRPDRILDIHTFFGD